MNLKTHYNNLYTESIKKISNANYQIDELIDSSLDQRFGITLIIKPSIEVKNEIQKFLNQLKSILLQILTLKLNLKALRHHLRVL